MAFKARSNALAYIEEMFLVLKRSNRLFSVRISDYGGGVLHLHLHLPVRVLPFSPAFAYVGRGRYDPVSCVWLDIG
jgi:hypothetical protein